jgi:hypothetical protein
LPSLHTSVCNHDQRQRLMTDAGRQQTSAPPERDKDVADATDRNDRRSYGKESSSQKKGHDGTTRLRLM